MNQSTMKDWTLIEAGSLEESLVPLLVPTESITLETYFSAGADLRIYSDSDLQKISELLEYSGRHSWSEVPRIYTVLRIIGELQIIDNFLGQGITDMWFPFSSASLPRALNSAMQEKFLDVQKLVLTKGLDLEKDENKEHAHFGKGEALPFKVEEVLGEGGFSQVHKITSLISKRIYARKRFRRGTGPRSDAEISSFKNELKILKRIHHQHCVELVASYSDPKWFCLIMSPVADCDLKAFYSIVAGDEVGLATLRTFYGCLTAGLAYLHGERVRHRDIKPGNILVKGERVYLADFGISLDWLSSTRSTTTEDSAKTLLYCAPEVAQLKPRNSSSDIWSLGCVFLEITTVLAGFEVEDMRLFFRKTNDDSLFYNNVTIIPDWFDTLRSKSGSEYDAPLEWVTEMLQLETARRPTAGALFKTTSKPIPQKIRAQASFCGACCITDTSSDESGSDGSSWAVEHNFMKQNEEAEVSMRKDLSGSRSASDLSSTVSAKVPSAVLSGEITRLHLASQKGQINLVEQRLLANEPIEAVDAEGRTSLHRAAEAGHGEIVYLLLKNGANQHAKDNAGSIPKDLATDPIIIWLLKYGPEHNATDLKGDTFIHSIIRLANSTAAETIEWALGRGYSANSRDCEDNTPLICAVKPGFGHITQLLLHYGARITDKSTDGYPPLVLAARLGHYGVVKVLLDHGAPIEDEGPTRHCPALMEAAVRGHARVVRLLLSRGARTDHACDDGWTALSNVAADGKHFDVFRELVEGGADVNYSPGQINRHVPLAEACHWNHLRFMEYLIEKGADVNLHGRMHWIMGGDTLLIAAARGRKFEVCECLLKGGADAEIRDREGKSAVDWARDNGDERLVRLFHEHIERRGK